MTSLRPATKHDCVRLMELIRELAAFEKQPDAVIVSLDHFIESGFGAIPVWWAWVAEVDGRIEGFALYYIRYSTWKGCRLYLEDLIVTEEMRGKGLGKMLFEKLLSIVPEINCTGMVWQVLDWNEPAINFYKKYKSDFDSGWVNCSVEVLR